jgi:hypothetical protein
MSVVIDGYTLTQVAPPPNINFPQIWPFRACTKIQSGSSASVTRGGPVGRADPGPEYTYPSIPGDPWPPTAANGPAPGRSKSYAYSNTFTWDDNAERVEIYQNFTFDVTCVITKPPHIPNGGYDPNLTRQRVVDGETITEPNPAYDPIYYNFWNDESDEEIILIRCTDITIPPPQAGRPRYLDHITLEETAEYCRVSGYYDMIPTGYLKYVDHLSSATTSDGAPHTTARILEEYDITECPTRPESEIYYWTNDLTYNITYKFELYTNKGTVRTYSLVQELYQDWTRIRDWIKLHHLNYVEPVAAPSTYSVYQLIATSGKNTTTW